MPTKSPPRRRAAIDTYDGLVRQFQLRPIRSEAEHGRAVEIIGELMGRRLDRGASDYLDTLILLVNKYEDENHAPPGDLSPREALRAIMAANNLTQAEVGKVIGSESAVSMFLAGERELSKSHIRKLAGRFRVDAGLFL